MGAYVAATKQDDKSSAARKPLSRPVQPRLWAETSGIMQGRSCQLVWSGPERLFSAAVEAETYRVWMLGMISNRARHRCAPCANR